MIILRRFGKSRHVVRNRILICLGIIIILILCIDLRIIPVIQTMSIYHGKMAAVNIINEAVEKELGAEYMPNNKALVSSSSYDNLVLISRNKENEITSLEINMIKANLLKSRITSEILKEFAETDEKEIKLPLGTFLGSQLFSGRGPVITLKFAPSGYVESQFENHFESAGINQTFHQLLLTITAKITMSIPGYTTAADVSTDFIVAQTLINGTVPEVYIKPLK